MTHVPDYPHPTRGEREGGNVPPRADDVALEANLLGYLLYRPAAIGEVRDAGLSSVHFWRQAHSILYSALVLLHTAGTHVDPHTVAAEVRRRDGVRSLLRAFGGQLEPVLADLYGAWTPIDPVWAARRLIDVERVRGVQELADRLRQVAGDWRSDLEQVHARVGRLLADHAMREEAEAPRVADAPSVEEFLSAAEASHDWLMPGFLERRDRLILTGIEGSGKSTFGRQVGMQLACGIHPFDPASADEHVPARVLLLDLENSESQVRRGLWPLRLRAGDRLDPERMRVMCRIQGMDLAGSESDRVWMRQLVANARPDLVVTGPIYKMAAGDPNEEKSAKPVAMYLDQLRADFGCALWLEAHVGNELTGGQRRPERPFGWSGWRRWPEFGLWLGPSGDLVHWRGARDERDWPSMLSRNGDWPFSPVTDVSEARWHSIRRCILQVRAPLSQREIAQRTGLSKTSVKRTMDEYAVHYQALLAQMAERDDAD